MRLHEITLHKGSITVKHHPFSNSLSALLPNPNIASGKAGRGVQQFLDNLVLTVLDNLIKYY